MEYKEGGIFKSKTPTTETILWKNGASAKTGTICAYCGTPPEIPGENILGKNRNFNVGTGKCIGQDGKEVPLDTKTKNTLKAFLFEAMKKTWDWMKDHLFSFGKNMKRAISVGMFVTTAIVGLAALTQNTVSNTIGSPPPMDKNAATRAIDDAMDHGIGFYSDAKGYYALMKVDTTKVPVLKEADTFLNSFDLGDGTSLVFSTIDKDRVKRAMDSGYAIHRDQEIEPPPEHRVEFSREMGVITKVTVDGVDFNASQVETANKIYQENLKNLPETSSRIERDRAETRAATDAILSMVNNGLDHSVEAQTNNPAVEKEMEMFKVPDSKHEVNYNIKMGKIESATVDGKALTKSQLEKANSLYAEAERQIPASTSSAKKTQMKTQAAIDSILSAADQNNNKTKTIGMER